MIHFFKICDFACGGSEMMIRYLLGVIVSFFCFQHAFSEQSPSSVYLGSREADPASLVENVSTIHGDYSEVEVDLSVAAPDSLVLSRFYSSRDSIQTATLGGWRFNPHCFLSMQRDSKGKTYTTPEGKFERTYVYVGNPEGTILTYVGWLNTSNPSKRILFKIDPEGESAGIANTAKGNINCWTNLKNNELYFDPQTNSFELALCSEGRRFYAKHPSLDSYFITHEILPSGNKLFYEFDEKGQLTLIKETNHAEAKTLAWIKISYGAQIHIESSDGKTADYHFQQDPSGIHLLTQVQRSHKPDLSYEYEVVNDQALLIRKNLPEGRFVQIDYYTDKANKSKVKSIITPAGTNTEASIGFSYGENYTEVAGPLDRKSIYHFDDDFQLIAIEQYLDGALYRVHRKSWGSRSDAGNLISTSVENANGDVFYHKHFAYDSKDKGNIVEEREYGDVIGLGITPLVIDENGLVTNQDGHIKNYSYFSGKNTHGFFQTDAKGTGVKYWYKKGTNLLLKKLILTKGSPDSENEDWYSGIKERHFYSYNEDGALTQVVVDDGKEAILKDDYGVNERMVTYITPKQDLPNVGAPEIIEQKYRSADGKSEVLLKKTVNQFDGEGNLISQSIYDANKNHCYTITKGYTNGLLSLETDPLGNEIRYFYDVNQNLILETHSDNGLSVEYGYDLRNQLVSTTEKDQFGNEFKARAVYDAAGNKLLEIDRFGSETTYTSDSLGRPLQITYPGSESHQSLPPTYSYTYDLFDNPITVTDPEGRILSRSYNVHGKPVEINHLDGTKEVFRYDSGGNLHHYYGKDGLLQAFSYDYKGRINKHEHFRRGSKSSGYSFKERTYNYSAFHKTSEKDERGNETKYTYNNAVRVASLAKENQKVEIIYDALGRTHGVKKWSSPKTFTLEIKDYDLVDRVIEERTEDETGKVLLKKRYTYNDAGQLAEVIGYPQNKESTLLHYEYDGFGRLCKLTNAAGSVTTILYDDAYVNEWGQKTQKRTFIDPLGTRTEEVFDTNGHLIRISKMNQSGELLSQLESFFDPSGNKILEKALVLTTNASPRTYETKWSFNQADQLERVTLGESETQTVRFEYNSYGNIAAKYNPGAIEPITYQYNNEGNLEKISYKERKKESLYKLSYDRCGNITQISLDPSFTIKYSFNEHNVPLSETIEDEFGSYQVAVNYDNEGKIQTLQFPDGSYIAYGYEGPFVKSAKRYSKEKKELYHYQVSSRDLMGNILEEILPGHLGSRKQIWDKAGRRIEIATDFFQDKVAENGYDSLENIRKRETTLDDEKAITEYDYNTLVELIAEKGEIERKYTYDSIGNRLQKDGAVYKVNNLNQLVEAEGATYTFDANGNLATKTIGDRIWTYQSNFLNQIISIKDPNENTVTFTYDPSGKRLTKCIESKGKKTKIFRFFYLGNTEIGCVDEKGVITELKIPSNPNNPEAPSIAIEIGKETYVPLYDLQGNIICLLDHQRRKVVETYRYSIYGEEVIINARGRIVSESSVDNPWRYRGKRVDKEVGLIYFGYRYYDSEIGRWISPDPAGPVDGPNLYAYARNNPMTYVDYFGLSSTIDEGCGCTQHSHPGWCNAPQGCICICGKDGNGYVAGSYRSKIGSDIKSALSGISHGVADFVVGTLHDLQTAAVYMGAPELEISHQERIQIIEAVEQSQANQMAALGSMVMDLLSIDESDAVYQSFRSKTTTGLEIGSLVVGGYGAVKGVIGFTRLARMPMQVARSERIIAKQILTRAKVKNYLSNAESLSKKQIVSDLESIGLKLKGKSPDGKFFDFQDRFGNTRIKIHPPDKVTPYDHLHVYDKRGNPLNKYLEVVDRRSIDAHIPYGGE